MFRRLNYDSKTSNAEDEYLPFAKEKLMIAS